MSSLWIQFGMQGDAPTRLKELLAFVTRHLTAEIALVVAVALVLIFSKSISLLTLVTWVSSLWKRLAPAGQQRLTAKLGEAYLRRAEKRSDLKTTAALDDIYQAISLLRKALGEEPTREKLLGLLVDCYYLRARLHVKLGSRAAIASDLLAVIDLQPTYLPLEEPFFQFWTQLRDSDLDRTIEITRKAFGKFPGSKRVRDDLIQMLVRQRNTHYEAKDWQAVVQVSTELIELDPQAPEFYLYRTDAKRIQGDFKGALEDAEKLFERTPGSGVAYLYLGLAKLGLREYPAAKRDLTEAINDPSTADSSLTYYGRAQARLFSTDYAGAAEDYTVLIDQLGERAIYYFEQRAEAYYWSGSYDHALEDLTHVMDNGAATASTLVFRGDVYRFRGDLDRAIEDYQRAASLAPEQYSPDYGYGLALVGKSQAVPQESEGAKRNTLKQARKFLYGALAKAQKQAQEFSELYRKIAYVEDELGNFEDAANLRDKARQIEGGSGISVSAEVPFEYRWEAVRGSFTNPKVPKDLGKTLQEFIESTEQNPDNSQEHYGAGLLFLKSGDRANAIRHLNKVISLDPSFADAYYWRAWARAQGHDWLGVVADVNKAIALSAQMSQAYWLRGVANSNLNKLDATVEDLRKAIEHNPKLIEARRDLVWTLAQKKEWQEVILESGQALAQGFKNEVIYTVRAEAFRMTGELDPSVSDSTEALALEPEYALAYRTRGFALLQQTKLSEAVIDLNRAIELDGKDFASYTGRSEVRRRQGKLEEAMTDIEEAIKLSPEFASAYYTRGWIHFQKGEWDAALSNFSKAIDQGLTPEEAKYTYYGRGECYRMKRQWDTAIRDYTEAVNIDSKIALAYYGRALARTGNNDWDGAISDYAKAKENVDDKDLKLATVLIQRSWSYYERGLDELSLGDLRAALELEPTSSNAHLVLGDVLLYMGQHDEAISQYTRVIQLDPKSGVGYANRGLAWAYKVKLKEAIEDLTTAIQFDDKNAGILNNRAWTRARMGDWESALEDSQKALTVDSNLAFGYATRSWIRWWMGKSTEAVEDLHRVVEIRLSNYTLQAPSRAREDSLTWGFDVQDWSRSVESKSQDPVAYFGRGVANWMAGSLEAALDDLDQTIRLGPELTEAKTIRERVQREKDEALEAKTNRT